MSNFNVNYQFNTQLSDASAPEALIAITPHHHLEVLSQQHLLLSHTQNQQSIVLAGYLSAVIDILKTFRTLTAHVKEIKTFMGLDQSATADIKAVITQLQEQGFIISAEAVQQQLSGAGYNPIQEPPVVVVRTANRVSMLKRFLQSAVDNEQRYNARYQYLIIDDSKAELAEANAINIANSGLNVEHFDHSKQQATIEQMTQDNPDDAQAIQFLLGHHPLHEGHTAYGRSWNWGVLLTAGKPVVFLDDDCVLAAFAPPIEAKETVTFGHSGQDVVFLEKEKPLAQQLSSLALDPIAKLAEQIGLSPLQYAIDSRSFANADYLAPERLDKVTVKIVSPAVAGDPGSSNPSWLYHLRGASARRLWGNSEAEFRKHRSDRFAWVGEGTQHLSLGNRYSVVARAFDNRELLPATLPILRNEDALFTNLLHYLYPTAASVNALWAIAHLPEVERNWDQVLEAGADAFDMVKAIDHWLDSGDNDDSTPAAAKQRLLDLSKRLNALLSQDDNRVSEWMYRQQQSARAAKIRALHADMAANANAPDYWQKTLSDIINANIGSDQSLKMPDGFTASSMRQLLLTFAQSLPVWERLWQAQQAKSA